MLTWLQFGDLHASDADGWDSLDIFSRLVDEVNRHLLDAVDFAVLPGDNANHATEDQFRRIGEIASRLRLPLHILPGDHDFEAGSLKDFNGILGGRQLPYALNYRDTRCLFLDLVSAGSGGPDFRLGDQHRQWLTIELDAAAARTERPVIFMHAYPTDLKAGGDDIADLYSRSHVAFAAAGIPQVITSDPIERIIQTYQWLREIDD
jgi:3',5'-cyclic AMP phosphodiesterase CpdA